MARGVTRREMRGCCARKGGVNGGRKKGGEGAKEAEETERCHWGCGQVVGGVFARRVWERGMCVQTFNWDLLRALAN